MKTIIELKTESFPDDNFFESQAILYFGDKLSKFFHTEMRLSEKNKNNLKIKEQILDEEWACLDGEISIEHDQDSCSSDFNELRIYIESNTYDEEIRLLIRLGIHSAITLKNCLDSFIESNKNYKIHKVEDN